MAEKEEQTPPISQRTEPGLRKLNSVSRKKKTRSNPLYCGRGEVASHMIIPKKDIQQLVCARTLSLTP